MKQNSQDTSAEKEAAPESDLGQLNYASCSELYSKTHKARQNEYVLQCLIWRVDKK